MATTHPTHERTPDNRQASTHFPSGEFDHFTRWLNVAASAVGFALIYVGVVFSAGLAAAYLAALVPGIAGVVVFFTVGLPLMGAAPGLARRLCVGFLDALEPYRGA